MKKNSNYVRGFKWGLKTFRKEREEYGIDGIARCDKAGKTCAEYANNKKKIKTAKGKILTKELREYYRGISDGMLHGYNER